MVLVSMSMPQSILMGLWVNEIMYHYDACIYWTPVYPKGSYVITSGLWSVRPSLNISETALRIFLIFCMKLVHHKGTKMTESDF